MNKSKTKYPIGIAIGIFILMLGMITVYKIQVSSVKKNSDPVLFEVKEEDSGFNLVIDKLAKEEIIKSSFFTKIQARINGYDQVYVGTYEFDRSMASKEILELLENPNYAYEDISVQFLEGYWAKDIANILADVTEFDVEDYIDLWNNEEFIKEKMDEYSFLPKEILELEDVNVLLEGFLYPDTYSINPKDSIEEITDRMLQNGQNKYNEIETEIKKSDFSLLELYTLSSVVEHEAAGMEDMRKVAGVFMNRMEIDMPLQASATICYSLYEFDEWTECESGKNIQIESPYNTYKNKGLPPGPILNPSIEAIKATLNYDDNDYLYFVADVYEVRDGKVYYQKTYKEHEEIRLELFGY